MGSCSKAAAVSTGMSSSIFCLDTQEWPSLSVASLAPHGRRKQFLSQKPGLSRQSTASGDLSSPGSVRSKDECVSDSHEDFAHDLAADFDIACLVGCWMDTFGHDVSVSTEHRCEHSAFEAVFQRDAAPVKKFLIKKCSQNLEWTCGNARLVQANSTAERLIWLQEDGSENVWTRPAFDDWLGYGDGLPDSRCVLNISADSHRISPCDLQAFNIATPRQFFSMATPRLNVLERLED